MNTTFPRLKSPRQRPRTRGGRGSDDDGKRRDRIHEQRAHAAGALDATGVIASGLRFGPER